MILPPIDGHQIPTSHNNRQFGSLWVRFSVDPPFNRLTAAYERVRIRAADARWKPNGNIAAATDSAITVGF
jgi:hypothetical protein